MSSSYDPTGIYTGGHSLEERNAFIERWLTEYDQRHPGNTMPHLTKRKFAKAKWRRHVLNEVERDRRFAEEAKA